MSETSEKIAHEKWVAQRSNTGRLRIAALNAKKYLVDGNQIVKSTK